MQAAGDLGGTLASPTVTGLTHAGNYVASVATTSPLAGGAAGSNGAALTLTISGVRRVVAITSTALPPSTNGSPVAINGATWSVPNSTQTHIRCSIDVQVTGATEGPQFAGVLTSATGVQLRWTEFRTTLIASTMENTTSTGTYTTAITSGLSVGTSTWAVEGVMTAPNSASTFYLYGKASGSTDAGLGNGLTVTGGFCDWD